MRRLDDSRPGWTSGVGRLAVDRSVAEGRRNAVAACSSGVRWQAHSLLVEIEGPVPGRSPLSLVVLGHLEAVRGREPLHLGSRQERRVLAVLAVHANEVVSVDRLIDALWTQTPPTSAPHA